MNVQDQQKLVDLQLRLENEIKLTFIFFLKNFPPFRWDFFYFQYNTVKYPIKRTKQIKPIKRFLWALPFLSSSVSLLL